MRLQDSVNRFVLDRFIGKLNVSDDKSVRIRCGILAGWVAILANLLVFGVKLTLGLMAGSISILADAFHLIAHLIGSIVLVVSFWVASRPATAKTPFGHGRMEYVSPLIMSVILFVTGIQIGEHAVRQALEAHHVTYWPALPWILLGSILLKEVVGRFIHYVGERVKSQAIMANAHHHRIEAAITMTVIVGLMAGHHFDHAEWDGYIGIVLSIWLIYLGYQHARKALVPILGQAPSKDLIQRIRETAKSVEHVEGVHEVVVHDYGAMLMVSLHVEIPERLGPSKMHEVSEMCEARLRDELDAVAVCHSDPLMEMSPKHQEIERKFRAVVDGAPGVNDYHDFRIVAGSPETIIIVADIDADEQLPDSEFSAVAKDLELLVKAAMPKVAYCAFYVTPKFSY